MVTDLRGLGDELFARYSPYPGLGLRNHCLRLAAFVDLLLDAHQGAFPRDLVHLLAMVHDLGLVTTVDRGANYLERSIALFERETASLTLPVSDGELLRQVLRFNHRCFRPSGLPEVVEIFRQAVWIEHSRGLRRYGLARGPIAEVFGAYPRANLDAVLADFARRTIRHEPLTIVRGIFF